MQKPRTNSCSPLRLRTKRHLETRMRPLLREVQVRPVLLDDPPKNRPAHRWNRKFHFLSHQWAGMDLHLQQSVQSFEELFQITDGWKAGIAAA
jgi:hypothetical protein